MGGTGDASCEFCSVVMWKQSKDLAGLAMCVCECQKAVSVLRDVQRSEF